jgi:hypothetical protein
MQTIDALVIGCRGAESGYARLFRRGTATRATWYTDFEGAVPNSSGQDIPLDGNGAAVVYVNEAVDVQLVDMDGVALRSFTAADGAPRVEVISQAFTGTDYLSAAQGAGKPTTLQAVLDRWLVSAGAVDWKILFGGSAETIQTVLASVAGYFVSVKAAEYGAVGDGVADDTAQIQAAIDDAAGRVVFFPPGTYRITAALTVQADGNLLGCGCGLDQSVIALDGAAIDGIVVGSAVYGSPIVIRGLRFKLLQSTTGAFVRAEGFSGLRVLLSECAFASGSGGSAENTGFQVGSAADGDNVVVRAENCHFQVNQDTAALMRQGSLQLINCEFTQTSASSTAPIVECNGASVPGDLPALFMTGCHITSLATASPFYLVEGQDDLSDSAYTFPSGIIGCGFQAASARGLVYGVEPKIGNHFISNIELAIPSFAEASDFANDNSLDEMTVTRAFSSASAAFSLPDAPAGTYVITWTGSADPTLTIPAFRWRWGRKIRIYWHNNTVTGRSGSIDASETILGVAGSSNPVIVSLNPNNVCQIDIQAVRVNASQAWIVTAIPDIDEA